MIGISGRSQACKTCKRRKQKCDKERPRCRQCQKAALPCGGYADLVAETWANARQDNRRDKSKELHRPAARSRGRAASGEVALHKTAKDVILPDTLCHTAREQLYFGHYWSAVLPGGRLYSAEAACLTSVGWTGFVPQFYKNGIALKPIVLACAMASLSTSNGDGQLRVQALQAYNRSIHAIAHNLRSGVTSVPECLLAIRLVIIFEILFAAQLEPRLVYWGGHLEGQQALFLWQGPHSFILEASHRLFVDSRVNLALLAIGHRRSSCFNTTEWKTIPWKLRKKSDMDLLMDLMLEIPDILEQVDTHSHGRQKEVAHLAAISVQSHDLAAKLTMWAKGLGIAIFRFDSLTRGLPLIEPEDDAEFGLLHLCIVYWFNRLVLCSIVIHIEELKGGDARTMVKELQGYAFKSAYALPLLFQASGGHAQNVTGLLMLSVALRYYIVTTPLGERGADWDVLEKLLKSKVGSIGIREAVTRLHCGRDPLATLNNFQHGPGSIIQWF